MRVNVGEIIIINNKMSDPQIYFLRNQWFASSLDFSKFWKAISSFNLQEIVNYKLVSAFAIFGMFYSLRFVFRPLNFMYRNFLRPRYNLKQRYGDGYAMITGASDGIGKAYAKILADEGFNLYLVSRSLDKLEAVKKEINDKHGDKIIVKLIEFDFGKLADQNQVKDFENKIADLTDDIAMLVNNVGVASVEDIHMKPVAQIYAHSAINIYSQVLMSKFIIPAFIKRFEQNGQISAMINASSSSHWDMEQGLCFYAASKSFNFSFSEIVRKDYSKYMDVLTVTPRNVIT